MTHPPADVGQAFVSPPFNAVLVVALGLVYAHNRSFFCFLSSCAFLSYLFLALQQQDSSPHEPRTWLVKFAESESSQYLVLCLARWVASIICSGVVSRVISQTTRINYFNAVVFCVSAAFFFLARASGPETSRIWSATNDVTFSLYLALSLLAESLRGAIQVVYIVSGAMRRDVAHRTHIALYSSLIIAQNLSPNSDVSLSTVIDVLLQLLLLSCTLSLFLYTRISRWLNGRRRQNGEHNPQVHLPPHDADLEQGREEEDDQNLLGEEEIGGFQPPQDDQPAEEEDGDGFTPLFPVKECTHQAGVLVSGISLAPLPESPEATDSEVLDHVLSFNNNSAINSCMNYRPFLAPNQPTHHQPPPPPRSAKYPSGPVVNAQHKGGRENGRDKLVA